MRTEAAMPLLSMVTEPVRAMARPLTRLAPVAMVTLARARILPSKAVVEFRVAELPTCHYTLPAPPPITVTEEAGAVVRELPIWKMNTALGSPSVFKVRAPVRLADELKWYTPGASVKPPKFTPDLSLAGR